MFLTVEIKEVKQEIGRLVKALRKQRGLTQAKLAESLDVSRTTIRNLESGRNFTVDTMLKILNELDLLEQLKKQIEATQSHLTNSKPLY